MSFRTERDRLTRNLIEVVERYAEHTGMAVVTALGRVAGMTHVSAIWAGGDIKAGTYDKMMVQFSDAWPDDLPWPESVPRPPRTISAQPEAVAG